MDTFGSQSTLHAGKDPYNATNDDFYKSPIVATTRNMVSVFKEQGFDEDVATVRRLLNSVFSVVALRDTTQVALHAFVRYGLYFPCVEPLSSDFGSLT